MEQQIRFCTTSDGVRIAYATVGRGAPLVKAANWLTHLEFDWRSPVWSHWLEELASDHLLVRYDERGCGLSDWSVQDFSFNGWVRDLESVVDSLGLQTFVLLGISQGGAVAVEFAARHPERVSHLILYGAYARGWGQRGSPQQEQEERALITLMREGWGRDNPAYRQVFTSMFVPGATAEQMRWFNDLQRVSASPENAVRFMEAFGEVDVKDRLTHLSVPALVLHARRDAVVPFEEGRQLASMIPGARFVPLESANHLLLESEPAWEGFLAAMRAFLGVEKRARVRPVAKSLSSRTVAAGAIDEAAEREAHSLVAGMEELALSRFSVVGRYMKYDERTRQSLKEARQKIVAAFASPARKRENYLFWAAPGSGKTYLVQQIASHLLGDIRYVELNLAKLGDTEFASALENLERVTGPSICFVDEIDARPEADWPYERLLPYLDVGLDRAGRLVFVLAGSSGSSLVELRERIAARPKGGDLLSRVPRGNEYELPPLVIGDRILVAGSHFRLAGRELGRDVNAVEKLALYYVCLNGQLTNARQLRELAVRAVERLLPGDDRIRYDHLFSPGDPENKAFWVTALPVAEELAGRFTILTD